MSVLNKEIHLPPAFGALGTIPIGCVTTFLFLSVVSGIDGASGIYFSTIVCTGGVSLILWVPLWIAVGGIVLGLLSAKRKLLDELKQPQLTKEQHAATGYIRQSRISGLDDKTIASLMAKNGWSEDSIKEVFALAKKG